MEITSVKRIHQSDWTDEGVRFLRARDIVSASKGKNPAEYLYITKKKYEDYSKVSGKVQKGDLLVTGVGSIGIPYLIKNDNPIYFKDGNIIWFKNENRIYGHFFYYSFMTKRTQKYIRDVSGLGTVGTYTIDSGKKTSIQFPVCEEQQQIGTFFQALDNLIALYQRKIELLKETKKVYLDGMFPQKGYKIPRYRFNEFADPWEQDKLGNLGKVYTGNTPPTADLENWTSDKDGFVWITPTDIDKLVMNDSERHLSSKGWSIARTVPKNSVLITSIASIGKNAINSIAAAFNQQINAIVPEQNDAYFILSYMVRDTSRFATLAGQTATAIINKTTFEKFTLMIPSIYEQQRIGTIFQAIDNLITLHQRKSNILLSIKDQYLNSMLL